MSETINCPSCAAELDKKIKSTKHIVCEYCYSSLFFEDDSIQNLGVMAEVIDEPSILQLNIDFEYRGWNFVPIGRVRYDYGRGWWDEWYVMDTKGETKWISVDEGQIAIEEKEERIENSPIVFEDCFVGDSIELTFKEKSTLFTITEKKGCKNIAAEGELPFPIISDEEFNYIDLISKDGISATIEIFNDGSQEIFFGSWIDAYDLKRCY